MRIVNTATAFPQYYFTQREVVDALKNHWERGAECGPMLERLFFRTGVEGRHYCRPLLEYQELNTWGKMNDVWIEVAEELGERAIDCVLRTAGVGRDQIGALFFVSVTGVSSPSIDARLVGKMKLNPRLKRNPIFGLGCVAGAAGIARAADYVRAYPDQVAVLLSVELCSLTWQRGDINPAALIATGLFGDGAVAVLIAGDKFQLDGPASAAIDGHTNGNARNGNGNGLKHLDLSGGGLAGRSSGLDGRGNGGSRAGIHGEAGQENGGSFAVSHTAVAVQENVAPATPKYNCQTGPKVVASTQVFYPDTQDVMGWKVSEKGFQVVLSPEVPSVVRENLGKNVDEFLATQGMVRADIGTWIMHTGGPKVLEATAEALDLKPGALDASWEALKRVGNLSSGSVLVVLDDFLKNRRPPAGSWSILAAMGPGFCAEMSLLQW